MSKEYLEIGPAPWDEEPIPVGSDNYIELGRIECQRFIAKIREFLGNEPEGSRLKVTSNAHDYGSYYSVEYVFDPDNTAHVIYADLCDSYAPARWDQTKEEWEMQRSEPIEEVE